MVNEHKPSDFTRDGIGKFVVGVVDVDDWKGKRELPCLLAYDDEDNIIHGLHWYNTKINNFEEGEGEFDHIETELKDGQKVAFCFNEEMLQWLLKNKYPIDYRPEIDQETYDWYSAIGQNAIESFLERN